MAVFDSREKLNMTEVRGDTSLRDLTHNMSDLTPSGRNAKKRYGRKDASEISTSINQSKTIDMPAQDILFSTKNSSKKNIFHRRNHSMARNATSTQNKSLLRIENNNITPERVGLGQNRPSLQLPTGAYKPKVSFAEY